MERLVVDWSNVMDASSRRLLATWTGLTGFMLAIAISFGCQGLSFNPKTHAVPESKWVALPSDGEHSGTWSNEDLSLRYVLVRNQSRLRISGSIQFTERITKTYLIIHYFHMDLIPVDAQGKVLDMLGVVSAASVNTMYDYSVDFNRTLTLPSNCEAIAFSYRGRTAGTRDAGSMDFWEYPVH